MQEKKLTQKIMFHFIEKIKFQPIFIVDEKLFLIWKKCFDGKNSSSFGSNLGELYVGGFPGPRGAHYRIRHSVCNLIK